MNSKECKLSVHFVNFFHCLGSRVLIRAGPLGQPAWVCHQAGAHDSPKLHPSFGGGIGGFMHPIPSPLEVSRPKREGSGHVKWPQWEPPYPWRTWKWQNERCCSSPVQQSVGNMSHSEAVNQLARWLACANWHFSIVHLFQHHFQAMYVDLSIAWNSTLCIFSMNYHHGTNL